MDQHSNSGVIYSLKLTEQQLVLIGQAIGELPHKFAAPLILAINEQIIKARSEAAEKEPTKKVKGS